MSNLAARIAQEARERLEAGTPGHRTLAPAVLAEAEPDAPGVTRALPEAKPYIWDAETLALLDRFWSATFPAAETFELRPGVRIVNIEGWMRDVNVEVQHGPEARRAHTGTLKEDLLDFLRLVEDG